jgi:glycosyltransferase involved in cell wall biosynthesis
LHIIGSGEEAEDLRALALRRGLADVVLFHAAVPFGPRLFEALYPMHLLLAAPLSEDTPRSALDAMAAGIPILAFSTGYYSDLEESGAVDLVPWPSVERLAERIAHYAARKRDLVPLARAGIEFARGNTQETWLRSRVDWTLELFPREAQHA